MRFNRADSMDCFDWRDGNTIHEKNENCDANKKQFVNRTCKCQHSTLRSHHCRHFTVIVSANVWKLFARKYFRWRVGIIYIIAAIICLTRAKIKSWKYLRLREIHSEYWARIFCSYLVHIRNWGHSLLLRTGKQSHRTPLICIFFSHIR